MEVIDKRKEPAFAASNGGAKSDWNLRKQEGFSAMDTIWGMV